MASNNDLPQCQLCQELYNDPLLLPCLHSFCKKCLVSEREQQGSSEGGKLKCPSCQEYCEVPSGGVTGFIQNINLARKVEVAKIEEKMKSKENIPCDRCVKRQNAFAVSFCYDCLEFLCNACKEDHEYSRHTMKHKLLDIESKQAMTEIANKCKQITSKPLYCPQHEEEKLKFYCEQCNTLTCRDCIVMDHVGHSMKPQNAVAEESREELKKNIGTITTEIGSLDDIITQGETIIERIKNRQGEVEREINTSFDAVIEAVENRRKTLLTEATSIANGKICAVKEQLDGCRKMRKDMVHVEKFAQDISENHSPTEVLNSKKLINARIQQMTKHYDEATIKEIEENDTIFSSVDPSTLHKAMNSFGCVSTIDLSAVQFESGFNIPTATINEERKVSISLHDTKGSPIPFHSLRTLPIVSTLKDPNGQESNVPHSIDQESGIVSFLFTPKFIGEHYLSIKINGSHINKSPYRLMVRNLKNYGSLTKERSFIVGNFVTGVAVQANGDVYASAYDGGCIKVFSGNGTLKQTIGSQGNGNGQFNNPRGITILDDVLYVAENSNHRVQKLSLDGRYIGQFGTYGSGQGQFNYPWGITHDCNGRILVADYDNKRVQVFDGSSCLFLKSIDCQGNNPLDVAIDNDGNIHVAYSNAHCVAIFSPDGQQHITNYSNTSGHFQYPRAITIDEKGYRIVTCQYEGGYLHIMDTKGQQVIQLDGFNNPHCVAIDQYGTIYVADYSNKHIIKFV